MTQIADPAQVEFDAAKAAFDTALDRFRTDITNTNLMKAATEAARRLDAAQIAVGVSENIGCTYCRTGMDKFSEDGIRYALGFGLLNYGDSINFNRINPNVSWPENGRTPACYDNLEQVTQVYIGKPPVVHSDRIVHFKRSDDGVRGFFQRPDNGIPVPSIGYKNAGTWQPSATSNAKVRIDNKGCPVFEPIAEILLPPSLLRESDARQFRECNQQVATYIADYPQEAKQLPVAVLQQYQDKKVDMFRAPDKYTWHHHQDTGRMQLVETKLHKLANHTGGQAISGGDHRRETRNKLTGKRERLLYEARSQKTSQAKAPSFRRSSLGS